MPWVGLTSVCVAFSGHFVMPVLSGHSKRRPKLGFQDHLLLNAGQKYCRMLLREHSAILLTLIKLPHVFKTFVLSIFEWPLKTGFTIIAFYVKIDGPTHGIWISMIMAYDAPRWLGTN